MHPDKLDSWLRKPRNGAVKLRVNAPELGSPTITVAEWTIEEISDVSDRAGLVLDACTDYCDSKGESVQFRIEWLRRDGSVLTSCFHRAAPVENADGTPVDANAREADIGVNRIIAQFLRHDEIREKVLVGSLGTIFGSLESTIKLQGNIIDQQGRQLVLLHQHLASARTNEPSEREATDEERTEALARAQAWNKLAEFGPLAMQAILEEVAARRGGNGAH